ncbi:MAG: GNAT family N-acetyltransferase [Lachnospiraceae bacterium]|nr:GNAT family N-acetyltransferase [Lachnospiraceae bacterium]
MKITYKKLEIEDEIRGKAYVHWKAWHEAYADIVDPQYLEKLTLEKCESIAMTWRENNVIALDGGSVIGFACYGPCRDEDLVNAGEVSAIYILSEYYGQGIGCRLMQEAMAELADSNSIVVWVLAENARAIRFYERCGFAADGCEKVATLGSPVRVVRMVLKLQRS